MLSETLRTVAIGFSIVALSCTHSGASSDLEDMPLEKVADIPMPGPAVRFDYQSLDQSQGRLYISHMNAGQLVVFDIKNNTVVANLDAFPKVHGVWAVPELGRVYASTTAEHKVAVVDRKTLQILAKVGPIDYPDGLAYAPAVKRVFVSDEHGGVDAAVLENPVGHARDAVARPNVGGACLVCGDLIQHGTSRGAARRR